MLHILCLLGTALNPGHGAQGLTRRSVIIASPAAALGLAAPAFAVGDNKVGYQTDMSDSATRAFTESSVAGKAGIRFGGSYSDPLHPGCQRKIIMQGGGALINGADEDKKKYTLKADVNGKALYIDYSSKGGPKRVRAEWNGLGLVFDDGTVWTKQL